VIKDQTIDEALIEIMRTKKALEALRAKRKEVSHDSSGRKYENHEWVQIRECVKEHSAAKRASLDLTRKLADLRAGK
jgi:hypothetical protein